MLNCNSAEKMPIPIAAIGAVQGALISQKIKQAQDGSKTFTPPKTGLGRLIGTVTGRTQATQIQETMKKEALSNSAVQSGLPITGGLSFGGQATRNTWLPFAIVAAVALYFFTGKKRRRR
jgi:hypothetical protein